MPKEKPQFPEQRVPHCLGKNMVQFGAAPRPSVGWGGFLDSISPKKAPLVPAFSLDFP